MKINLQVASPWIAGLLGDVAPLVGRIIASIRVKPKMIRLQAMRQL